MNYYIVFLAVIIIVGWELTWSSRQSGRRPHSRQPLLHRWEVRWGIVVAYLLLIYIGRYP